MVHVDKNQRTRVESHLDVSTYLDRLKYAIDSGTAMINFQKERNVDVGRKKEYTNAYTVHELFPDEDLVDAMKRELKNICVKEYIETVKDLRFPNRSEMRVFGRLYEEKEIYIKIRVELMKSSAAGTGNYIFIMSFHHSTIPFRDIEFPYKEVS